MYATNVRELKKNPSLALRQAKDAPVLILKGDEPDALLIHLDENLSKTETGLRPALAANLYKEGVMSLGKASKLSGLAMSDFIRHLGSLGIEIVKVDETTAHETKDLSVWL
ncbi:MAG: prevent-host-death protein [Thiothrix sp.]|nr:MAG: prevent-host-death protein [Thiothrix sp.]